MFFLQQVVNGVAVGGVYSILAIGWTMVWGIVGMINWTHGEVFMLGAYAGYYLLTYAHAPILVALAGASVFSAALAIFIDKVFYRPLRLAKAPRFAILITALGVSTFLKNTTSIILQPEPKAYPKVISLPAVPLLKIAGQTVNNVLYQDLLASVAEDVQQGQSLSSSLSKHPEYFPPLVSQMLVVGESTGQIDKMLARLAGFYSRQVDGVISNVVDLLQPLIMVIIGGLVGLLFASILLPMYQLTSSIQ